MQEDTRTYAKCKACNTSFYPYYVQEMGEMENLCGTCKRIAMVTAYGTYEEELALDELGLDIKVGQDDYHEPNPIES